MNNISPQNIIDYLTYDSVGINIKNSTGSLNETIISKDGYLFCNIHATADHSATLYINNLIVFSLGSKYWTMCGNGFFVKAGDKIKLDGKPTITVTITLYPINTT